MVLAADVKAQLEAGPGGAVVEAGLQAGVGDVAGQMAGDGRMDRQRRIDDEVRVIKTGNTLTVAGDGTAIMGLGGPKLGYAWAVKRISVADATLLSNTVAGAAYICAGAILGTANKAVIAAATQNLEWIITPLPNAAGFGGRFGNNHDDLPDFPLAYGEHLYVYISGGTANQVLRVGLTYGLRRPFVGG